MSLCHAGEGGALVAPRVAHDGGVRYYARGVAVGGAARREGGEAAPTCRPPPPLFTALAKHEAFIRMHFNP